MIKFIVLLVVLTFPNIAEAKFEKMADQHYRVLLSGDVGKFGYRGCPRELVEANPFIAEEEKPKFTKLMEDASITASKYIEVTNGLDLPEDGKVYLRELVAGRECLFLAHLEEWGVPAHIIKHFNLKKTYEVDMLREGEICMGMSFTVDGRHKMRNIIFAGPDTPALVFKTDKSRLKIVLKCSNGCVPTMDLVLPHIPSGTPTVTQELRKGQARSSVTEKCPDGYQLVANVWSLRDMPLEVQREVKYLISLAARRDTRKATDPAGYRGDAVSRSMGAFLRKNVQIRAEVNTNVQVFFRHRRTAEVAYDLGTLRVRGGSGNIDLFDDPRKWIVEAVFLKNAALPKDFVSPVESGGERRLWVLPEEWRDWCWINVHGIMP